MFDAQNKRKFKLAFLKFSVNQTNPAIISIQLYITPLPSPRVSIRKLKLQIGFLASLPYRETRQQYITIHNNKIRTLACKQRPHSFF